MIKLCCEYLSVSCIIIMSRTRFRVNLVALINIKELFARNRRDIYSLRDSSRIQTHNHLVRKRTLNHLAKLAFIPKLTKPFSQTEEAATIGVLCENVSLEIWQNS